MSPRNPSSSSANTSGSSSQEGSLREIVLISLHSSAALVYGYALVWQYIAPTGIRLHQSAPSSLRDFGRWRFLTHNCMVLQFIVHLMALVARLRKPSWRFSKTRDFLFTTLAFPIGTVVVASFWAIWFLAGPKYISPASVEGLYPSWHNHVSHTIPMPINMLELFLERKLYPSDWRALPSLVGTVLLYTTFLLYIRSSTGKFPYPFLNKMEPLQVAAFIAAMLATAVASYKLGQLLHDSLHGALRPGASHSRKKEGPLD